MEENGGAVKEGRIQESGEIYPSSQRDWERESQKEDKFFYFGIIMIIKTL